MSAMTNLMVKDDTTGTVVEFTLKPITDTPNPLWRSAIANVPLDGQIRAQVTWERVKSGAYKATLKVEVPVMETLGASGTSAGYVAPPKVAYVNTSIVTMFADARSTIADRANLVKMTIGLMQGASSTTATGTLDQASAADAWKASTAPITGFFINAEMPN